MTITIKDVRVFLQNMSNDRVSDETIEKYLKLAIAQVDAEKSENATETAEDNAVLTIAGYGVYLVYAAEYERSVGQVPPSLSANLTLFSNMANYYLLLVRRGTVGTTPLLSPIQTMYDDYIEGAYQ